jgi:hypothetical protein
MKKFSLVFSVICLVWPAVSWAHGVGQVYNLPIPLKYYLGAAGLAVAVSFFLFAFFLSEKKHDLAEGTKWAVKGLRQGLWLLKILTLLGVLLLMLAGILGSQNALLNFTPLYFWVVFIIGFGLLSLVCGNIWEIINPWKLLFEWVWGKDAYGSKKITPWVGVILLFGLYWLELASGFSFVPNILGGIFLIYTFLNLILPRFFGNWFVDAEVFAGLFGFIGKLSPVTMGEDKASIIVTRTSLRLKQMTGSWPKLMIGVVLLAGTSFDSFKETVLWFRWLNALHLNSGSLQLPDTLGLLLAPIPFLVLYCLAIWLMKLITKVTFSFAQLSKTFLFALIPIAFGYTLAHNFSLVIVSIPQLISLISDPFGFGWKLFGTAAYSSTKLILGAKIIWYAEIGLVVLAHIIGTWYAHILAVTHFEKKSQVLKSQYPMLVLMVAFTVMTLWLLSQPLVVGH